ncbi:MAG: hypothetical protein JWO45_564, partial [Spartobacteria bacterium]|nr:hypothetical protein [Spartobacteria bacterium]
RRPRRRRIGERTNLLAEALFQFPNAQGGEEEGFGAGKSAGCGHWGMSVAIGGAVSVTVRAVPCALIFLPRFRFAHGAGSGRSD